MSGAAYPDAAVFAEQWAQLKPGGNLAFARGETYDRRHPVVAMVLAEQAAGRATLHRSGQGVGRVHIVQRCCGSSAEMAERASAAARAQRDRFWADTPEGRVLAAIEDCAERGLPCPTNADLARAAGLRSGQAASYRLGRLAELGKVRVRREPGSDLRVVTICETGLSTSAGVTA